MAEPGYGPASGEWDQGDLPGDARLEPHRGAGGHVEPLPARRLTVDLQRVVGLGEVVVRADLHGPVAGVDHRQRRTRASGVQLHRALARHDLPGDHGIGRCTVTSLVPSGKVASICTESSISGTPSITSSRVSTVRPASMRSATPRPSRAPSMTYAAMTAVASGWLSRRPRARRARASPAATWISRRSCSCWEIST